MCIAFRELRDDEDSVDVSLACDDERIQSHKVILSACDLFFRNVLRRNLHQNPLFYQKGVKYSDLQSVLKLHVSWRDFAMKSSDLRDGREIKFAWV